MSELAERQRPTKLYRLESAGEKGHVAKSVQALPKGEMAGAYDLKEVPTGKGHGFAWGYGGTGAAILAASLVADAYDEQVTPVMWREGACRAWMHHQQVKERFVVRLRPDVDVHVLSADEIRAFCEASERQCEACDGSGKEIEHEHYRCTICNGLGVQRR